MKIAVTSTGANLNSSVDPRFGRCVYFILLDTDSMAFEPMENPNIALGSGAGIQSAQLIAEKGVQTVLTGNCGPNAFQTFRTAGIQVIIGVSGSVKEIFLLRQNQMWPATLVWIQVVTSTRNRLFLQEQEVIWEGAMVGEWGWVEEWAAVAAWDEAWGWGEEWGWGWV